MKWEVRVGTGSAAITTPPDAGGVKTAGAAPWLMTGNGKFLRSYVKDDHVLKAIMFKKPPCAKDTGKSECVDSKTRIETP